MNPVIRIWLAFAAIGAALIHLAVGASAPLPLAIILVGLGIAELGWGVATLVRGRTVMQDATIALALVPVFVWGVTATLGSGLGVSADSTGLPFYPMAIASLFDITLSAALAIFRRRGTRRATAGADVTGKPAAAEPARSEPPVELPAWRFLATLMIGSVLFSGLTTSALAATEAGAHAVPHGTHSTPAPGSPPATHSGH
ncbi:MAG: hypothetical protein ABIX44_00090 [Cryobacterium sp.]